MAIEIREIKFGSADYKDELKLRDLVLRRAIGLTLSPADVELDSTETHLGAFDGSQLVGCILMRKLESAVGEVRSLKAKMRQVAVSETVRGQGVGRQLVERFEELARTSGATEIVLDARETAVAFYMALGYEVMSDLFTQVTVPHRKMRKSI